MCGLPTTCYVELMVVVTVCFKLTNGSIAIIIVVAWSSTVYVMDIV
jgi:hypothetical protein